MKMLFSLLYLIAAGYFASQNEEVAVYLVVIGLLPAYWLLTGLFGFSKDPELTLANNIGACLHGQIRSALQLDESNAGERATDMFTSAYVYSFVHSVFEHQGYDANNATEKHLKHICHGVLPGRLYKLLEQNSEAYEFAVEMKNGGETSPDFDRAVSMHYFGTQKGGQDAQRFSLDPGFLPKDGSLYQYLLDGDHTATEEPNLGKAVQLIAELMDKVWREYSACSKEQVGDTRINFALFRYGFVDGFSQKMNLDEEAFFRGIGLVDYLQEEFEITEVEQESLAKALQKSQSKGSYSEFVMLGGKESLDCDGLEQIADVSEFADFIVSKLLNCPESNAPNEAVGTEGKIVNPDNSTETSETPMSEGDEGYPELEQQDYDVVNEQAGSLEQRLRIVKDMQDKGLITEEMAEKKKKELLSGI